MMDARELLDAYGRKNTIIAAMPGDTTCEGYWTELQDVAPKAFAALRAVLALAEKDVDEWQAGKDEVHPFHGFSLFNPMYQPRILVSDVEAAIRAVFEESQ